MAKDQDQNEVNDNSPDVTGKPAVPGVSPTNQPPEGVTTRDDALDAGVPMVETSGPEPVGPEDALGSGPKRGDYTNRIGPDSYNPHESVLQEDGTVKLVPQRPRAEEIGDTPGEKGGVTNASESKTD